MTYNQFFRASLVFRRGLNTSRVLPILLEMGRFGALGALRSIVFETTAINTIVEAGIEHAVEGISNDLIVPYITEAEKYAKEDATNDHQLPWMKLDHVAQTFDFLYLEEPDEPLDNADFPLSHFADSIGRIYARGSWEKDATWLRFECGDYYIGHQHYEVGNFEIYREEPLATESGYYDSFNSDHSVNWYIRTIAHNGILISMPGEIWPTNEGQWHI